jgi:hypothetical protein
MIKLVFATVFLVIGFEVQAVGLGDIFGANIFGALIGRSGSLGNDASVDDALVKVSAQMNKKMPIAVDQDTRLDSVSAEPGKHLTYHYTLVSVSSSDVDQAKFNKLIKPQLKTRLCESVEMKKFLKNGVTISYLYRGNDGHLIGGAEFSPSDCISRAD